MKRPPSGPRAPGAFLQAFQGQWTRHFFHRKESLHTTWKLRFSLLILALLIVLLPRDFWTLSIGRSLECAEELAASDALLAENFDPNYLVFERARALQKAGIGGRILVPVVESNDPEVPNRVSQGTAELMAGVARIEKIELIPIAQVEPISLNAARQILAYLERENLESVTVVTPGFRSRRSLLVYRAVLEPRGITVRCVPVFGTKNASNWTDTWHGIQEVGLQFMKLQYYRFYVLL